MTKDDESPDGASEMAAKGGRARAKKLSKEARSAIARNAAQSRWDMDDRGSVLRATHEGPLKIGAIEIPCAVLADGTRVLTRIGFLRAIGWTGKAKGGRKYDAEYRTPVFLTAASIKSFITKEILEDSEPIQFRQLKGGQAIGYKAALLPRVCSVFIAAKYAGKLRSTQNHVAERCRILSEGFAIVGITALVDEATGFQAERARDELQKILAAYISSELLPWTQRFPDEFFRQIYRVHGWEYKAGTLRGPRYVGKLINKLVYEQLPKGVLAELRRKNPPNERGYRKHHHHRFLTEDIGEPHLQKQIIEATTIARLSQDKAELWKLFRRAFPKPGVAEQADLDFGPEEES